MRLACLAAFALTLALLAVAALTARELSRINAEVAASNAALRAEDSLDNELHKVRAMAGDRLHEIGGKVPLNLAGWAAFVRQVDRVAVLQAGAGPAGLHAGAMRLAAAGHELSDSAITAPGRFWRALAEFREQLYKLEHDRAVARRALNTQFTTALARERALSERWTVAMALGAALITSAIVLFALWMQRCFVGPVRRIARALADGSAADLSQDAVRSDEIGALARAAVAFREMADERAAALRSLEHAARHDALTRLPNRQSFDEALAGALAAGAGDGAEVALLCLDLDRFKDVNDTHGHAGGDALLRTIGALLTDVCGDGETAYRVGGDEFTIIQRGLRQPEAAQGLTRRLLREFQLRAEGDEAVGGVSIGVAVYPHDAADETRLRHYGDLALYRAKHDGRGRARFFSAERSGRSDVTGYVPMPSELAAAIAGGDLRLHYQPKMRARTNDIEGAEALVRWQHPTRGLVAPNEFIPIAEKMGQIRALTEWTLERAVADQAALVEKGCGTPIYVNISACLLGDPGFADAALKLVEGRKGAIGFEITETGIIDDPQNAMAHLRHFVDAGLRVAIDDYGSGMSSLAYLKQLPAHELKIDRTFIGELSRSHRDPLIVRSTIDLAHALGLEVTAEGVEKLSAFALLRAMGCDMIQGYLVARPMPVEQLQDFLADKFRAAHITGERPIDSRAAQLW